MERLDGLQKQLRVWRLHNFGPGSESWKNCELQLEQDLSVMMVQQTFGVVEEVGELVHAILKRLQGIRGMADKKKFNDTVRDAIGDIVIYIMGLCDVFNWDLSSIIEETAKGVLERAWDKNKENGKVIPPRNISPVTTKERKIPKKVPTNLLEMDRINRELEAKEITLDQLMTIACAASSIKLITGERDEEYNQGGIKVEDFWEINGIKGPLQMIHVKYLRLISLTSKIVEQRKKQQDITLSTLPSMVDNCVDLISYVGFFIAHAYRITKNEEVSLRQVAGKYKSHSIVLAILKELKKKGEEDDNEI